MNALLQDLRYAARSLRKNPGFSTVAVLTLALGIGATVAIFSVVDATVLRPLPFTDPARLLRVWETTPDGDDFSISELNYVDFREQNRSFVEMAAYKQAMVSLTGDGEPERLEAMAVTHTLFPLLGATPALGRTFLPDEDQPGGDNRVAVLSHELWQRRFGGDPAVIGQTVTLDGESFAVTGVMRPGFDFPGAELWIPLAPGTNRDRGDHWLGAIGRLAPGASIERARADLGGISRRMGEQHPHLAGWGVRLATFPAWLVDPQFRRTAYVLFGAVGFLLLMACANLANLLFARGTTRRAEIAVRSALGAGRARVVRQLLTESVLLALLGATVGLLGAFWAVQALQALEPASIPRLGEVGIDGRVLAFTLGVSLLTSLVFGLAPAMRASSTDLSEALRQGGRGGTPGRHRRVRDALVVSQVALAMVLLVGAGLLIRSFLELRSIDPGFDAERVLAVSLELPQTGYAEPWRRGVFYRDVIDRLETLPGVTAVGATMIDPFGGWNLMNDVTPAERAAETGSSWYMQAGWRAATPGFFRAMNIPLLSGRLFSEDDPWDGPRVTVITQSLARQLWPDEDAVGKRLFWGGTDGEPFTVVGVAGDYRDVQLEADPPPIMFIPHDQLPMPGMTLMIRTAADPAGIAGAVRLQIRAMDPNLPIPEIRPLERNLAGAVAGPRFRTLLLGFFAAVALLLAAVGIYGVMAFSVSRRTRELGLRLALGARPEAVLNMVMRRGVVLALLGITLGAAGAFALTRFLDSLLYDTAPTDLATFAAVSLLLATAALLASYIPARRAMRVDPMVALRSE